MAYALEGVNNPFVRWISLLWFWPVQWLLMPGYLMQSTGNVSTVLYPDWPPVESSRHNLGESLEWMATETTKGVALSISNSWRTTPRLSFCQGRNWFLVFS